jgi:hypothetical protein
MSGSSDGHSMQLWPYGHAAGQDQRHFPLGASSAIPAAGYFADAAGLSSEQEIKDAIAGLSDEQEIEDALVKLLGELWLARGYMRWRMRIRGNALRPQR